MEETVEMKMEQVKDKTSGFYDKILDGANFIYFIK